MIKDKDTFRFIDKLYKNLYKSEDALRHYKGKDKTDKFKIIEDYFNRQENIHNYQNLSDNYISVLKQFYYDRYVIKEEDIPNSVYELEEQMALELGYGHIEYSDEIKKEKRNIIINDQKASLDVWLDYFFSEDSNVYPFWLKYWAFQGMLKIGKYEKETGEYTKRNKNTIYKFIDLNREALAMSMDLILKTFMKEKIEDSDLEMLVNSGSFAKIYTYIMSTVLTNNKDITKKDQGEWVKYNRGSNHMLLVKSLQGYNTGWCTAGESIAKAQLSSGDFYVYYTLNNNGEYKIPRIAIRMQGSKIEEIRGVAQNQNLEPEMEQVVREKIKDFPDNEKYYKKENDMKLLTQIYKKQEKEEDLTIEELKFLYEINYSIDGFGYKKDPRIGEIKEKRNIIEDLNKIFSVVNEIKGDLDLSFLTRAEGLALPQTINGYLDLRGLTIAEDLVLPQTINGRLFLSGLTRAEGLVLPQTINGGLNLSGLTRAEGLVLPQTINGYLDLRGLTKAEGLVLPQNINGKLFLSGLTSVEGLVLPQTINGDLDLSGLTSVEGLVLPQTINGSLDLRGLTSVEGLALPQTINGDLDLSGLTSTEGLILPNNLTYYIILKNCVVITPENVDEFRNNKSK